MEDRLKFLITVDTEADNQWRDNLPVTTKNIEFLPRFQKLCEKYGFVPVYLLSYEIVEDEKAVEILRPWLASGKAMIGAHLHPWTTPPFVEKDKKGHSFPSEYEFDILEQKLRNLTEIIKNKFGIQAKIYRAGRWGFCANQAEILRKLGYEYDCSITPKVSWQGKVGSGGGAEGPDFRFESVYSSKLESGITELPITILFTGLLKKENAFLAKQFLKMPEGFLKKVVNRLFFRQKWLRVFRTSTKRDWLEMVKSARKNKLETLEFMIHSSELMPGGSPYAKNEEQLEVLYERIEECFVVLREAKVKNYQI